MAPAAWRAAAIARDPVGSGSGSDSGHSRAVLHPVRPVPL